MGELHPCDLWCDINPDTTMDEFRDCLSTGPNSTNGTLPLACKLGEDEEESRGSPAYMSPKATTLSGLMCAVLVFGMLYT